MISVIMPVYNAASTLQRAVNSVLSQSYEDFELILVDDGSQDQSLQIAQSFTDPRIRILKEENRGAAHARNYGMQEARGERICFIDCDDTYLPGYLEQMNAHHDDLVICKIQYEGEKKASGYPDSFSVSKKDYPSRMEEFMRKGILNSPVTKLYQTALIRTCHLQFDEQMKVGEDLNFNLHYVMHAESFYYLAEELYHYNMQEDAGSHRRYIPDIVNQRRINIDLLDAYFKEHQISSDLMNQLKVKLIYITVMQEMEHGTSQADIAKMINIPYFRQIKNVKGLPYQIMLKTYQKGSIKGICRLASFLRKVRKYADSASA